MRLSFYTYYISAIEIGLLGTMLTYRKSHSNGLGLLGPNRYVIYLSNEVLNIDFGQGATKISEVKVGRRKKYLPTRATACAWVRTRPLGRYFF